MPFPVDPSALAPLLQHLARAAKWYRWWLTLLYEPALMPLPQPFDFAAATLHVRMLAGLTDELQELRPAETSMGAAALT
jgi:hypothetical protein